MFATESMYLYSVYIDPRKLTKLQQIYSSAGKEYLPGYHLDEESYYTCPPPPTQPLMLPPIPWFAKSFQSNLPCSR